MVNPGPFRLCSRCGADMRTLLQESGGLRRTAAAQSPMPMIGPGRLGPVARAFACAFVLLTILSYVAYLFPPAADSQPPAPTSAGQGR